jgi:hypothetical protein
LMVAASAKPNTARARSNTLRERIKSIVEI